MSKPIRAGFLGLVVLIVLSGGAIAQTAAPVQSFASLQPLLVAGQEVIVWDEDGRKMKGKLVSVDRGTLEIQRPRLFRRGRREVFAESSVRRIEHRDSTALNGGLIGFAAGLAVAIVVAKTSSCEDLCHVPVIALAPLAGPIIGAAIDGAINRPLFVSPRSTNPVTVGPVFGRDRAVVSASFRF